MCSEKRNVTAANIETAPLRTTYPFACTDVLSNMFTIAGASILGNASRGWAKRPHSHSIVPGGFRPKRRNIGSAILIPESVPVHLNQLTRLTKGAGQTSLDAVFGAG
jgi:hypothetical protein